MEEILCELRELTESELDVVTGGNSFSTSITAVTNTGNQVMFQQGFASVVSAGDIIGLVGLPV